MPRPYYIPPILTAAVIALGMLATVTTTGDAEATGACAMPLDGVEAHCAP